MRKLLTAAGVLSPLFVAWLIGHAAAQDSYSEPTFMSFELHVQRDELTAACPEEAWFVERVAAHTEGVATAGRFEILLTRQGPLWHARIVRWEAPGAVPAERTLYDGSVACEPLAEAVALTVALLADDSVRADPPMIAPPEASVGAELSPPSFEEPSSESERPGSALWLAAGLGGAAAFIAPAAPLFGAGLGLDVGQFRAGLRLMFAPEQSLELEPGRVLVQAWLGTVLGCFASVPQTAGIALCAALDGGLLHGSAAGFERRDPSTRYYGAAGVEAQPSVYFGRGLRLTAILGAGVPFYRESFSVTGLGVGYRPPAINLRALFLIEAALL